MKPLAERVERISDAYEYSTDRENGDAVARAELREVAEEMRTDCLVEFAVWMWKARPLCDHIRAIKVEEE